MLSAKEIVQKLVVVGQQKIKLPTSKVLLLGILAGFYIGIGGLLAVTVGGGIPEIKTTNPGLQKFIFGAVFPLGLVLVVIAGAELFTGNTAIMIPSVWKKKIPITALFKNWSVV